MPSLAPALPPLAALPACPAQAQSRQRLHRGQRRLICRGVGRWQQVSAEGLCDRTVADIVKRCTAQLGRARGMTEAEARKFAAAYSGHSTHAGIAVEAINRGVAHESVADHHGHASTDMTRRYSKRAAKGRALVSDVGV